MKLTLITVGHTTIVVDNVTYIDWNQDRGMIIGCRVWFGNDWYHDFNSDDARQFFNKLNLNDFV